MLADKPLVTAQYYGDSGGSTVYYYWVQANFSWGKSPLAGPASATVLSLSHNNVVSINWSPMPGATSYDVLRNTTGTTPTGTQTVAIATNLATADGLVDNGLPAFSYVVSAGGAPALMADAAEEEKKQKAAAEQLNKDIDAAIEKYEKEIKEEEKVDQKQADRAKKLYDLHEAGVRLELPSRPKTAAEQAKEQAGKEKEGEKHDKSENKPELTKK